MRVRDYLKEVEGDVTFIEVIAIKLDGSPIYNSVYRTTPIRQKWEWEQSTSGLLDAIVIKKNSVPIDETGLWQRQHRAGHLKCCMIKSVETLNTMYSPKQAQDMLDFYERKVK